ncbi:MAG: hypothetical protein ACREF3_03570, partial [Acetobacteraceae bacterium]
LGAMFVVMSIGSGFFNPERARGISTYTTPNVVHAAGILIACAVLLIPGLTRSVLAVMIGLGGIAGFIYVAVIGRRVWRRQVDLDDRIWHALVPPIAYATMVASAIMLAQRSGADFYVLAASLIVLLVAVIRNAWDLIVFFALRARD